ncbi:hypothetical protein HKD37_17G048169 [Glycine soja]
MNMLKLDISQPARSKTWPSSFLKSLFSFSSCLKSVGNCSLDTHICRKPLARTHKTPYTALRSVARREPYIHYWYEESFKFRAILLDLTAIVTVWVRGQFSGSALVDELQGHNAVLKDCIEQLTTIESSRTSLVSLLREALEDQEFKLGQVRSQIQVWNLSQFN